LLQRLGSLKRCDCFGDDRMAGSGRLPAVSGRRHESRDWRIRGLSDRPPRAPAFVLAQAFAAQGVRVAPHLRERHGDFGGCCCSRACNLWPGCSSGSRSLRRESGGRSRPRPPSCGDPDDVRGGGGPLHAPAPRTILTWRHSTRPKPASPNVGRSVPGRESESASQRGGSCLGGGRVGLAGRFPGRQVRSCCDG
jgi:hypothetical protein